MKPPCVWTAHATQPLKTYEVRKLYGERKKTQSPSTIREIGVDFHRAEYRRQMSLTVWTDGQLDIDKQSCKNAGSEASRQCTREGVGTGSLGLVTTLALLLIWRDRVDRQVDRRDRAEVTRLSVQTLMRAPAVEGKRGALCSRVPVSDSHLFDPASTEQFNFSF